MHAFRNSDFQDICIPKNYEDWFKLLTVIRVTASIFETHGIPDSSSATTNIVLRHMGLGGWSTL